MGNVSAFKCECGYEGTLFIGEGMLAVSVDRVRRTFAPEELVLFEETIKNNTANFRLLSAPAHCQKCRELVSIPALRYVWDGQTKFIYKPCQTCDETVIPIDEIQHTPCPKCSLTLRIENTDNIWD